MDANHGIRIDYDEPTGRVTASHRCSVAVAGHRVRHSREVELTAGAAAVLAALIDVNRGAVEAETTALALAHAAAVAGRVTPGTKTLSVGGTLTGIGTTQGN